ncbi:hypothetical protein ABW19_dt0201764 [Dactylella cylindrospora]|nr:hypothetical protein ABW19_dt0201764 [Dactylella cylindrospora]
MKLPSTISRIGRKVKKFLSALGSCIPRAPKPTHVYTIYHSFELTAAERVLGMPELLEQILLYIQPPAIFKLKLVHPTWNSLIKTSPSIKYATFHPSTAWARPPRVLADNPDFKNYLPDPNLGIEFHPYVKELLQIMLLYFIKNDRAEAVRYLGWEDGVLSRPPISDVIVELKRYRLHHMPDTNCTAMHIYLIPSVRVQISRPKPEDDGREIPIIRSTQHAPVLDAKVLKMSDLAGALIPSLLKCFSNIYEDYDTKRWGGRQDLHNIVTYVRIKEYPDGEAKKSEEGEWEGFADETLGMDRVTTEYQIENNEKRMKGDDLIPDDGETKVRWTAIGFATFLLESQKLDWTWAKGRLARSARGWTRTEPEENY